MNLNGRMLKSVVINNWPFYGVKSFDNGTMLPDSGIDVNIMRVLTSKLNFT